MIIDIVKSNFKIIIFGFVFTFFSCIGQSFFIGLFNSSIRDELNITHGEFGTIYGIATLCSSVALIWIGKKIDDLKLVTYSILVTIFLFSSCIMLYNAASSSIQARTLPPKRVPLAFKSSGFTHFRE